MFGIRDFDPREEFVKILEDNIDAIVELMRDQLSEGVDITGSQRSDQYRPWTIAAKKQFGVGLGAVTDRVTFFMTGTLYSSLFVVFNGDTFEINSSFVTYEKMVTRIGREKFGLDLEKRTDFANRITIPLFAEAFNRKTGLTIQRNAS